MSKTISILKRNGEVEKRDAIQRELDGIFKIITNGEYVLTVARRKQKRSLNQNALMWMWFECLAQETGHTKEQFHEHYCSMFLKKLSPIDGQMVVGGTRKLTKEAFTDFLNKVQADAATYFGVILPTPEDLYWSEFEDYYKQYVKL
jgi:hypothetical protein